MHIGFSDQVWRNQPRGQPQGVPKVVPEVDPGTRGQENCYKLEHRLGITQEYKRKSQIDAYGELW